MHRMILPLALAVLAGCATPQQPSSAGRFLQLRLDGHEGVLMQIDLGAAQQCREAARATFNVPRADGETYTCTDLDASKQMKASATLLYTFGTIEVAMEMLFQTRTLCNTLVADILREEKTFAVRHACGSR